MAGKKLFTEASIVGRQFGFLTPLEEVAPRLRKPGRGVSRVFLCRCICGKEKEIELRNFHDIMGGKNRKKIVSCGCKQYELIGQARATHRSSHLPEYQNWMAMRRRCLDQKDKDYPNYGGKSIIIDKSWLGKNGFENFLRDMGSRPSKQHTLDRYPDKNGNYMPTNCRWATKKEQANNRNVTLYPYKNESHTIPEWSKILKIPTDTIYSRTSKGLSFTEAVEMKRFAKIK